ncbi:hypothetical protein [Haloarcula sp. Atlit-7R]|uniref:DUF7529 family protein n=1 Tax=Haloarcula sp. Atlit-7R TaxID=2282125 RepID=UPI000EF163CB|nr:hypothetical protein [Haloarcula sp. Atlit-7R]RLM97041.1 hypothetical protein D3D01_04340 [Haloarcula sp. Atlit-7R]
MNDPADPESNPFGRVVGHWEQVIDDMAATTTQYRDDGREAIELHPGDVTVLTGEPRTMAEQTGEYEPETRRLGFDVVVSGDEFRRVADALEDRTVDRSEVFRATGDGMVFLLVALECGDDLAVLVPLYYDQTDRADLSQVADDHGLYSHIRPLTDDEVVTVSHEDPEPFFPG